VKTILCYGDSNTYGADPADKGGRLGRDVRWPGVLRADLGDGFLVIEEGLNGRTTGWDDPMDPHLNGRTYLTPCLRTHQPLDLVVIMLGTNDLKARFALSAADIAESAGVLVETTQREARDAAGQPPRVLLVAPPPLANLSDYDGMFEGGTEKSRQLGEYSRRVAGWKQCAFLDAGRVIVASDLDGIHFAPEEHAKLGRAVAATVRELLA